MSQLWIYALENLNTIRNICFKRSLTCTGVIGAGFSSDADLLDDGLALVLFEALALLFQLVHTLLVAGIVAVYKQHNAIVPECCRIT